VVLFAAPQTPGPGVPIGAEQLTGLVLPLHDQTHWPAWLSETPVGVPAAHKSTEGATRLAAPFAVPHAGVMLPLTTVTSIEPFHMIPLGSYMVAEKV